MKNNKIIYSLNIEDVQTVAQQELERKLSNEEIESIINSLGEKINWYEAIAVTISERIR
jgi:hypothetical protein